MNQDNKKIVVNKETLLPLGMVFTLCAGVIWISNQLTDINHKLDILEKKLEDQWTKPDMENWALRFKMNNPNISIPDIEN